ncbi:hypothetical protein FGIG_00573 [Fasciola gigantica]|uniref:Lysosome-associated membrane glycoprotein 5 n=1 Tax=Fasciola gigantica TaxID=46835 RepID=A0A504Y5D7_FASGI|nr:hypothetical protein FGIG_00573 [Fasciola gigantica]
MLELCNTPQTGLSSVWKMNHKTVDSKQLVFFVVSLWAICMQLEAEADPSAEKNAQYSIKDQEGNFCLLMNFTVDLSFTYTKKDQSNGIRKFSKLTMNVADASSCDKNVTTLVLKTRPENATKEWTVEFEFSKNVTSKTDNGTFRVISTKLTFTTDRNVFPDVQFEVNMDVSSADSWGSAPVFSYYHCMAPKLLKFSVKKPVSGLEMRLTNVMLEAFVSKKKSQYSDKETLCDEDQTPDNTVPVAVGIALAVCIVVALIVFIVFNQRNRRRYGSV